MKKLVIAGLAAAALALTGCGASNSGYAPNGSGWTSYDWDMNNPSIYNNNTYCNGGTYVPQPNSMYSCSRNGVTSTPSKRPTPVIPPKTQQKAPAPAPKQNNSQPKQNTQPKQQSQPKAPSAPKPAAPAPKAPPAPKTGK